MQSPGVQLGKLCPALSTHLSHLLGSLLTFWAQVSLVEVSRSRPLGIKMCLRAPAHVFSDVGAIRSKDVKQHLCWSPRALSLASQRSSVWVGSASARTNGQYTTRVYWSHVVQKESHVFRSIWRGHRRFMALDMFVLFTLFGNSWWGQSIWSAHLMMK